jgi:hypothetical protein
MQLIWVAQAFQVFGIALELPISQVMIPFVFDDDGRWSTRAAIRQ